MGLLDLLRKPEDEEEVLVEEPVAPAVAPAPNPNIQDPMVRDYMMKIYGDKFSDKARADLVEENSGWDARTAIAAALSGKNGIDVIKHGQAQRDKKIADFDRQKQGALAEYDMARKMKEDAKGDELMAREADAASEESKLAQTLASKMLPSRDFSGMSAAQISKMLPSLTKIYDVEQKKLDRGEMALARNDAKNLARQDKLDKLAQLSDKQVEAFTDIDVAASDLTNIMNNLGDNKNWVGPVDGRIPDMLVGADQAAFRSALGKYKDAYRKAITGAGAGPGEIAILEKRLPSETDSPANFKAKVQEAQKELARKRDIMASNLEKRGKNVEQFKGPTMEMAQSKVKMRAPDGKIKLVPKDQVKAALAAGGSLVEDSKVAGGF